MNLLKDLWGHLNEGLDKGRNCSNHCSYCP
jgi:hypothetical protein